MVFTATLTGTSYGQCQTYTESFEATGCPATPCPHIDDDNCLPGWATSQGGAHVSTQTSSQGNSSLRIDFNYVPAITQGAFLSYAFQAGTCYEIVFDRAVGGFAADGDEGELVISLANGLVFNGNCTSNSEPSPASGQPLFTETLGESSTGIQPFELRAVAFTPPANFSQLWFRTGLLSSSDPEGGRIFIDNLTIQEHSAGFEFTQSADGCFCLQFTAGFEAGTHLWDFGDGSQTSSELNPVHCFPDDGPYTVTHTVTTPCGDLVEEIEVTPGSSSYFDFVIGSDAGYQSLQAAIDNIPGLSFPFFGFSLTQNVSILVEGELDIDVDGSYVGQFFSECSISMAPGAGVNILPDNRLVIQESTIGGCDARWRSIDVANDATLNLIDNHLIADGQYAVEMHSKGELECRGNLFDKNYVGIFKGSSVPLANSFFQLGAFTGNEFRCTGDLLPHFDPDDPDYPGDGTRSYAGIELLLQSDFFCGANGGTPNTFDGLRNGILIFNGNLDVRNSSFANVPSDPQFGISGNGIRLESTSGANTLRQRGLGQGALAQPSFDNCHVGIRTIGARVETIQGNTMEDIGFVGAWLTNSRFDAGVSFNDIDAKVAGIFLQLTDPNTEMDVNNNNISIDGDFGTGIFMEQVGLPPSPGFEFTIRDNNVNLFAPNQNGVLLLADRETNLFGNSVIAAGPSATNFTGYRLWSSQQGVVRCNYAEGLNSIEGSGVGYLAINAPGNVWQCNETTESFDGFRFEMGGFAPGQFIGNVFSYNNFGLHVTTTGQIGKQAHTGNRWLDNSTFSGAGARHDKNVTSDVEEDQFTVHQMDAPGFDSEFYPSISVLSPVMPGNFFEVTPGTPNASCDGTQTCGPVDGYTAPGNGTKRLDTLIANGGYQPADFTAELQWLAKDYLYRKLQSDPGLVASGSVFDSFLVVTDGTALGELLAVERDIRSMHEIGASRLGGLQDNFLGVSLAMDTMAQVDSLLVTATGQDSLDLLAQRAVLSATVDSLTAANQDSLAALLSLRSAQADSVRLENGYISATDTFELNERTVNALYLSTVAKDILSFDSTQTATLEDIAFQCPMDGGGAVFRARSLLSLVGLYQFDDAVACDSILSRSSGKSQEKKPNVPAKPFLLVPNPANGMTTAYLPEPFNSGRAILYDGLGRPVKQIEIVHLYTDRFEIDLRHLSPGIYRCHVLVETGSTYLQTLVITKN